MAKVIRRPLLLLTKVLFLLIWTSSGWGASLCYDEKHYPSVNKLEQSNNGFKAYLGGKFLRKYGDAIDPRFVIPTLVYTKEDGWKVGKESICSDRWCFEQSSKTPGKVDIPPITLTLEEAVALQPEMKDVDKIEQKITAWTEYGGLIWFGIGFYSGEGTSGIGGVGRYDPKTGKLDIRRPNLLRDVSIYPMLYDGKSLWLGTYGSYECIGYPPVHGLVRYNWDEDKIESFEGKEDGPCGHVIHDLFQQEDCLWVATDIGMSLWDSKKKQWSHYIPAKTGSSLVQQITCKALYTDLLNTLPKEPILEADFEGYYVQLFNTLTHFRPQFIKDYIKTKPASEWGCAELKVLAKDVKDFKELKRDLLIVKPVGSPHFECLLYGFGSRGSRELAWRDFLLSIILLPRGENFQIRNTALDFLEPFSGDEKVGNAMLHLLKTAMPGTRPYGDISKAIEILPITLGKKSIPFLIDEMDRFKDDTSILESIVEVLEKATHHYWTPDGIQPIPANKPRQYFEMVSDEHFVLQWKAWWKVYKSE